MIEVLVVVIVFLGGFLLGMFLETQFAGKATGNGLLWALKQGWLSYSQLHSIIEHMKEGEDA